MNISHSLSVVVPIYNTSQFLEKCVDSLFLQSVPGMQLIFLDDASTDNSREELERVLRKHSCDSVDVVIDHSDKHLGQSLLRERAKKLIRGRYVFHCDSDDWIDPGLLRLMYERAIVEDLDIVTCDLKYVYEDDSDKIWKQEALSAKDMCSGIIRAKYSGSLCNKLIKKEIIEREIVIPKVNMGEDWACCVQYAYYSQRVGHVGGLYYNYFRHQGSTSYCEDPQIALQRYDRFHDNFNLVVGFMSEYDTEKKYYDDLLFRCVNIRFQLMPYIKDPKCLSIWRSINPEMNAGIFRSNSISIKDKVKVALVSSGVYTRYLRFRQRILI